MQRVIVIRYSEIHLKGRNRSFFESALIKNIKEVLSEYKYTFRKSSARYLICDYDETQEEAILQTLHCVFGIYSISSALYVATDMEEIANACIGLVNQKGTFKVVTNRADKRFPKTSMQISAEIGGRILRRFGDLKVDVNTPDWYMCIDVRENGKTLCYIESERCVGGMPVGTAGKGILLLSGGIDSPVAGYMMAKRGMTVRALHFHSYPFTSLMAKQKVLNLASIIKRYCIRLTVDVVNFAEIQTEIHNKCPEEYMITIMRRFMMRIACIIASRYRAGAIITGESLGQVASQTMESITSTSAVADKLIFRPLIGMDKEEIIAISKRIGTFNTSIEPYEDCCTVFLPKNPVIHPRISDVEEIEKTLDIKALIDNALTNIESIVV